MAVTRNFRIDAEISLIDLETGEAYHFDYIKQKAALDISDRHEGPDIVGTMAVIATDGRSMYIKETSEDGEDDYDSDE